MHKEAIRLFCADMREALVKGDIRTALNRLSLFELMYAPNDDRYEEPATDMKKKVLLLRLDGAEHQVCDEYYPDDYGRVHIVPQSFYGHFYREEMVLEYKKITMGVAEIVYEDDAWPADLTDTSPDGILNYFGVIT